MLTASDIFKIADLIDREVSRCEDNAAKAKSNFGAAYAERGRIDADMLLAKFKATHDIGWED